MFTATLNQVKNWTDNYANEYFGERFIVKNNVNDDSTFAATIRALLVDRTEDKISLYIQKESALDAIASAVKDARNSIYYYVIPHMNLIEESVKTAFGEVYNGFKYLSEHSARLCDPSKSGNERNAGVFINKEKNVSLIITTDNSAKCMHLSQVFMRHYLPKYFDEKPLTELEKQLLMAMTKTSASTYLAKMDELSVEHNMNRRLAGIKVRDFDKQNRIAMFDCAKTEYERARVEAERAFNAYLDYLNQQDEKMIRMEGLKAMVENAAPNADVIEFFEHNPNVEIVDAKDGKLMFIVDSYIDTFDSDAFESNIRNRNGWCSATEWDAADVRLLFDNILNADPEFRIRTCGLINLQSNGAVSTVSGYNYGTARNDRIPNPHMQYFACLGQNGATADHYLREGNIVAALVQCVQMVTCVNVTESMTFDRFVRDVVRSPFKIIEDAKHNQYTPAEVLKILKERKPE